MGLFDGWKVDRAIARAHSQLIAGQDDAGWAAADEAVRVRGPDAWVLLADKLAESEHRPLARAAIERALKQDPESWNAIAALADLLVNGMPEEQAESVALYRKLNAKDPTHEGVARVFARLVVEKSPAEAVGALKPFADSSDHDLRKLLATAQYGNGQPAEALATLEPVIEFLDEAARAGVPSGYDSDWVHEVQAIYSNALGQAKGDEAVMADAARRRMLAANAGENYRLLAVEQMRKGRRLAAVLELRTPEQEEQHARALLEANPKDVVGLCELGSAALRTGEFEGASKQFVALQELEKGHFGASRGLGAVLDQVRYQLRLRVEQLPAADGASEALTAVVPDWAALTDLERRVVHASIAPLAGWALELLKNAGLRMRILPLDVRTMDVPELAKAPQPSGVRLAGHGLGCVAVEELLDVNPTGWGFAHELAHLVHRVLPPDLAEQVKEIWEEAGAEELEAELTDAEHRDASELFALAYTAYLGARYGGEAGREVLPGSAIDQLFALFDSLAREEA